MKKLALIAAAAAATLSTPALASSGEGRVEVRGGGLWASGYSTATVGGAAGYDFDLGSKVFLGIEASFDLATSRAPRVGFRRVGPSNLGGAGARLGVKASDSARLYLTGGAQFGSNYNPVYGGAGIQVNVAKNVYLKAEYRHLFGNSLDSDVGLGGIGLTF